MIPLQNLIESITIPCILISIKNLIIYFLVYKKYILVVCTMNRNQVSITTKELEPIYLCHNLCLPFYLSTMNTAAPRYCVGSWRWRPKSDQLSNKFGYCRSWTVWIFLAFHKRNSLPLGASCHSTKSSMAAMFIGQATAQAWYWCGICLMGAAAA